MEAKMKLEERLHNPTLMREYMDAMLLESRQEGVDVILAGADVKNERERDIAIAEARRCLMIATLEVGRIMNGQNKPEEAFVIIADRIISGDGSPFGKLPEIHKTTSALNLLR